MDEPGNGRPATNSDIYRAVSEVKELVKAWLEVHEVRLLSLEEARTRRFSFGLAIWPAVIAALVGGIIAAAITYLP